MPRKIWPLSNHRPAVRIVLTLTLGGQQLPRDLLADTGAGPATARFELLLNENDCIQCGSSLSYRVTLGGAYAGVFPLFMVRVQIPELGFHRYIRAVGVRAPPRGFDGLACFRFLNRFTYGNFGDAGQFGLET